MTTTEFENWLHEVIGLPGYQHNAGVETNVMISKLQRLLDASFFNDEQRGIVAGELTRLLKIRKLIWNT